MKCIYFSGCIYLDKQKLLEFRSAFLEISYWIIKDVVDENQALFGHFMTFACITAEHNTLL